MKPGVYDLEIYQGDTFRRTLRLRQRVLDTDGVTWISGAYIPLTGYTGAAQVRETKIATDVTATMTVTVLDQTITPGGVTLYMPASATSLITKDQVWDLQLTAPNGDVTTFLAGAVTLVQEVTRL